MVGYYKMSLKYPVATMANQSGGAVSNRPSDKDLDEFVINLKTQIEIFVNRMKSNSSRGRPIANDSSVQVFQMLMYFYCLLPIIF